VQTVSVIICLRMFAHAAQQQHLLRTEPKFSGSIGGASTVTSRPKNTSQQVSAGSCSSSRSTSSAQVPFACNITIQRGDSRGEYHDNNPSPCNLSIQSPYSSRPRGAKSVKMRAAVEPEHDKMQRHWRALELQFESLLERRLEMPLSPSSCEHFIC
jgi:hypothetical protein